MGAHAQQIPRRARARVRRGFELLAVSRELPHGQGHRIHSFWPASSLVVRASVSMYNGRDRQMSQRLRWALTRNKFQDQRERVYGAGLGFWL